MNMNMSFQSCYPQVNQSIVSQSCLPREFHAFLTDLRSKHPRTADWGLCIATQSLTAAGSACCVGSSNPGIIALGVICSMGGCCAQNIQITTHPLTPAVGVPVPREFAPEADTIEEGTPVGVLWNEANDPATGAPATGATVAGAPPVAPIMDREPLVG